MSLLFQHLPTGLGRPVICTRGSRLFTAGQPVQQMYCLEQGEIHLLRHTVNGTPLLLARLRDGDWIGEASLHSRHYHCDALSVKDSRLLAIAQPELLALLTADSALALAYIETLSLQVRQLRAGAERARLRTVRERLLHFIGSESDGSIDVPPLNLFAQQLGSTPEALYRTLAHLEQTGVLRREALAPGWRLTLIAPGD